MLVNYLLSDFEMDPVIPIITGLLLLLLLLRIKGKVKVQFTLEQGTKAQGGSRGISQLFL
jgi:hypothetical protein